MLWRRAGAFCVDYALAALLAAATLLPLATLFPNKLHVSIGVLPTEMFCENLSELPTSLQNVVSITDVHSARLCTYSVLSQPNRRVVFAVISETPGQNRSTIVQIRIAVDENTQPITPIAPSGFVTLLILLLVSAYLTTRGLTSPGKWLLGLRIRGEGCALCRELRRFGPLLILSALTITVSILPVGAQAVLFTKYSLLFIIGWWACALLIMAYYLRSLIRGDGQGPWNRKTGFEVLRQT